MLSRIDTYVVTLQAKDGTWISPEEDPNAYQGRRFRDTCRALLTLAELTTLERAGGFGQGPP